MPRSRPMPFWLITVFLLLIAVPAAADPPLTISFSEGAFVIDDLEPGAAVIVTTVERSSRNYVPWNERHDRWLEDEDGDGSVRLEIDREVPPKFAVIAVELGSGRFDVWTPEGSPAREIALPAHTLIEGAGNRLEKLEDGRRYVELLWVRPGAGAWSLTLNDGDADDEGPASDGGVLTSPQAMDPIGDSGAAPEAFERDDLLFRVAPREMEYYAARIVR